MELSRYIACICEGAAESAIIDKLVDNDKLIFSREDMLEEKVIRCRNAKEFEERYLRKSFGHPITVVRILDSRRERFNLSRVYQRKIKVINIITAPEIEILIIHNEGQYENFKRLREKPSAFCKKHLKMKYVKSYDSVMRYFDDVEVLIRAIRTYHRIAAVQNGEYTLMDILR